MPALLSSARLPLLSVACLACNSAFRAASSTPLSVSILISSKLGLFNFSSETRLCQDLVRRSPGWTSFVRVPTSYSGRAGVSRVYSMAALDTVPSIVVYVTVPNKEAGTKLAHSIIENQLAACVNQIPGVESTYWWEGKVETDSEILLMIKTRQALLGELTDHVNNNHPYDTPEVIALPITGGSEKYLKWIGDNTKNAEVA